MCIKVDALHCGPRFRVSFKKHFFYMYESFGRYFHAFENCSMNWTNMIVCKRKRVELNIRQRLLITLHAKKKFGEGYIGITLSLCSHCVRAVTSYPPDRSG